MVTRLELPRQSTHRVDVAWQIKTDKTEFHRCYFVSCFPISVFPETLCNLESRRHQPVGGFFGASHRRAGSASFEGCDVRHPKSPGAAITMCVPCIGPKPE